MLNELRLGDNNDVVEYLTSHEEEAEQILHERIKSLRESRDKRETFAVSLLDLAYDMSGSVALVGQPLNDVLLWLASLYEDRLWLGRVCDETETSCMRP